jgi:stage V sporulation protein K
MSFHKKIEKQFHAYEIDPSKIVLGHRLNPIQILELSKKFPRLNLRKEEIVLAFMQEKQFNGILSNQFLHIGNDDIFKIEDCNDEKLLQYFSERETGFILECIQALWAVKEEMGKSLEGFLTKYKSWAETNPIEPKQNVDLPFFDVKYLEMISQEASEAYRFCNDLNQDARFVQALNMVFSPGEQAIDGYKAEHLLLSDLVKAYNEAALSENEKSKFTLAFFFERLQGNDLAKVIGIERLNEMVGKPGFDENIRKIKSVKLFQTPKEYENEYIIPQLLHKLQHESFAKAGNIIYRFASIIAKADNVIGDDEKQALKEILNRTTNIGPSSATNSNVKPIPDGDTLETVMQELDALIGLDEVKKGIHDLINFLKISKIRADKELPQMSISLHSVFLGPPGTGKTTIARLLGRIFKHLNYLSKGQLVETDRAGMVAGYVGQTAIKVDQLITESKGGVLFVDEAYSLTPLDGGRDFGSEAVDALIKRMEDHRDDLVVIVAGYTEPMKIFIESNPGLRSRFNRYYKFDHFYPLQLNEIFQSFCRKYNFVTAQDASEKLLVTFELLYEKRDEGFGNAREVRNLFEICLQNQANRIIGLNDIDEEILQTFTEADIPEPKATLERVYMTANEEK